VRTIVRFLSIDGLHDLRERSIAESSVLRQTDGVLEARGILREIGPGIRRLPVAPELPDLRSGSGNAETVFGAPDADPEVHM